MNFNRNSSTRSDNALNWFNYKKFWSCCFDFVSSVLSTRFVGDFQILTNEQGTNLHNQYCYEILNDDENFLLLTAGYASGTNIHKINYQKKVGYQNKVGAG